MLSLPDIRRHIVSLREFFYIFRHLFHVETFSGIGIAEIEDIGGRFFFHDEIEAIKSRFIGQIQSDVVSDAFLDLPSKYYC